MKRSNSQTDRIQRKLGAQNVVPLDSPHDQGPLDLIQLKAELRRRLRSSGGRPSDPEWSIRRLIPFKQDKWTELELQAERCSVQGQRVSPSQLAAVLIERGLQDLSSEGQQSD